jgi:hypothetical protein
MQCIELASGPGGALAALAPPGVSEAWEGLRLPLSFHEPGSGYAVSAMVAVEILRLRSPEAARWWEENAPAARADHFFDFDEATTRLVDGLPSILAPRGHDGVFTSVGQFFWRLVTRARRQRFRAVDTEQLRDLLELDAAQWKALEASALTRPIVLMLASVIAEECCMRMQDMGSEGELIEANEEGHAVLVAIYEIAMQCGVDVSPAEIDRPLSLIDLGPQGGDALGPQRLS